MEKFCKKYIECNGGIYQFKMSSGKSDLRKENNEELFLQENRQRLVNSIADQIYNTIISKTTANQTGKLDKLNQTLEPKS